MTDEDIDESDIPDVSELFDQAQRDGRLYRPGQCVVDIAAQQPHLTIQVPGGVVVMPVSAVREVANGNRPLSGLGDDVIRSLLKDYLLAYCKE
jgi:hypothetical protein